MGYQPVSLEFKLGPDTLLWSIQKAWNITDNYVAVYFVAESQTSRGTHFAVAPPPSTFAQPFDTEIIFNARDATTVTLTSSNTSQSFEVPAMGSVSHLISDDMRVTEGLESKGLIVTSDFPITVHMASDHYGDFRIPDSTIVRPTP
jgi:hypothetical protein